ncbi:MAG: hypothetical protein HYU36_24490 [Planctomycetes bacterium]|nr:hypothetical protein [Planctomycetota bacterium]
MDTSESTRFIYFTSWQFVAQGGFSYTDDQGRLYSPSSTSDAGVRFVPGTPKGIRLVAQKAPERMKLSDGQYAPMAFHEGRYLSWYTLAPPDHPSGGKIPRGHNQVLCIAESKDGETWVKPELGLFELGGSLANNVVFRGDVNGSVRGLNGEGVFLDPAGPPEERFKMVYLGQATREEADAYLRKYPKDVDPMTQIRSDGLVWCLCGAVSPDGIHWRALEEPMLLQHCDTRNLAYYDRRIGQYVAYYRTWQLDWTAPAAKEMCGTIGRRSIGRALSPDFRHFSRAETLIAPGADMAPSHVWYGPGKTTLPGCPDQHVLFPYRWKLESDSMDIHLFSSPDGWAWAEMPGSPVITPGPPGSWDGGYVATAGDLLDRPDGRWALPYAGHPIPHKYPRLDPDQRCLYTGVQSGTGYALWPRGRLVALDCPEEGAFWTIPIRPAGQRLRLNASIAPTGYLRVGVRGIQHVPGRTLSDCDPLVGRDGLDLRVTWHGADSFSLPPEPIALLFELRQAKLFGVEFD